MELSVLIQQVAGNGYRASCGEPLVATAEGATVPRVMKRLPSSGLSRNRTPMMEPVTWSIGG